MNAAADLPSSESPPRRFDVVALGEAMVEFNQTREQEPHYLQGYGGDTSNAIIAAARAGARTAYLTRIGHDTWGEALQGLWHREDVDTSAIDVDGEAPTAVYFVTHGPQGHAFSYLRTGSAASRLSPHSLADSGAKAYIQQARWLHVSGISMAISTSACDAVFAAMQWARQAGTLVSLDANLRLKLWPLARARACLQQAVSMCDLFLPSLEDVQPLCGEDDPQAILAWAHRLGAARVVLKRGALGATVSENGQQRDIAGHAVNCVDATGAGDCFAGNLLARLALGDDLDQGVRYANAAAALAVQGFGAVAPLPHPEQVQALLA
jgi:2-dehydro-3-deoxygluconokinase